MTVLGQSPRIDLSPAYFQTQLKLPNRINHDQHIFGFFTSPNIFVEIQPYNYLLIMDPIKSY